MKSILPMFLIAALFVPVAQAQADLSAPTVAATSGPMAIGTSVNALVVFPRPVTTNQVLFLCLGETGGRSKFVVGGQPLVLPVGVKAISAQLVPPGTRAMAAAVSVPDLPWLIGVPVSIVPVVSAQTSFSIGLVHDLGPIFEDAIL